MNTFDLLGDSAPRPFLKWLPSTGGLLAAGLFAALVGHLPRVNTLSPGEIIGLAVENVLEVFLVTATVAWVLCSIRPVPAGSDTRRLILRTSLDALWLAPLALFIRENSPWAMVIAAAFVARAVKSFRSLHEETTTSDRAESMASSELNPFVLPRDFAFWQQASGAGATVCAEVGAIAAFAGYSLASTFLVGTASGIWAWSYTRGTSPDVGRAPSSQSPSRPLTVIALAILITAAALVPYLPHTFFSFGGFGVSSKVHPHRSFPQGEHRALPGPEKTSKGSFLEGNEGDPGVILWPEKQTTLTKLVAPTPVFGNGLLTNGAAKPLEIPFDGVYWFFKAPDLHPPKTSLQAHGSPDLLNIRSTDRRPLSMEAHEHLGSLLDLACCSKIQIAIRNADRYPESVSLELVLINTNAPGRPSQSLGTMMVKSTRPWRLYDKPSKPSSETLNFTIPLHASIRRFDEVMVVFRLDAARADAGPKIAIDRFVLVPRRL